MNRKILSKDQYAAAYRAAEDALKPNDIGSLVIDDMVTATLAAVDLLAPPFDPAPGTCSAMFADPDGNWWQCQDDPDHDGDDHDAGDWGWSDGAPDTMPRRKRDDD
ncbi:VOC family protein [Streptomyces olivaceus]|uniref:VOC family protein n=1 Tax=Streptomyces olivaceus TaxID=47716 RepID=UPI0036F906D7